MAIGNAVQREGIVYVYDEHNNQLFTTEGGAYPDGLKGYSSGTVNVQRQGLIYMLDPTGFCIGRTRAGN